MRVILVHGIRTSEGSHNIGKLSPYLEDSGLEVVRFDYGFIHFWQARFMNKSLGKHLIAMMRPGDYVVGHSNGCAVIWEASEMGAAFGGCVFINPALDEDKNINSPWTDIYYNKDDDVVWWSKFLAWHPWGKMGKDGYHGKENTMYSIDTGSGKCPVSGHSDIFTKLAYWGPFIADRIVNRWK